MIYDPDPAAIPNSTWFTRQLSQRDLALQVPLNYVTVPAISLTPACFAGKRYEDVSTAKCFSNLLALGFERFEIDIYWDVSRHLWSLCPVELIFQPATTSTSTTTTSTTTSGGGGRRNVDVLALLNRQAITATTEDLATTSSQSTASGSVSSLTSVTATTTLGTGSPTTSPNATPTLPPGVLIDVGPYSCTSGDDLSLLGQVMSAHLESTQNKLNATVKYMILNLHAAAPVSDPTGSAKAPATSDLPTRGGLLSSIISDHVGTFLYTPQDLQSERADLNASSSWFGGVESDYEPNAAYFEITQSRGHLSSPNGWPSASFVEMQNGKRILVSYGQIDPQLEGYNFGADASTIFPQGFIQSRASATTNSIGEVRNGCFYQKNTFSLNQLNSSWATYQSLANIGNTVDVFDTVGNLTNCGISPILNETLSKNTADVNYEPYQDYVQNSIWCWGPGQPGNGSQSDSPTANRCAAMNATSGFWQTENCAASYYNACRNSSQIYGWNISRSSTSYMDAGFTCPSGTEFTVPSTSLENTYLLHKWRDTITSNGLDVELLWLNFNDLDVKQCWVTGQNDTCPYEEGNDTDREVIVPTIAAIIVFVLAGLTIFVKCAANRQQSRRRRRRGDDGWDYEGVPS